MAEKFDLRNQIPSITDLSDYRNYPTDFDYPAYPSWNEGHDRGDWHDWENPFDYTAECTCDGADEPFGFLDTCPIHIASPDKPAMIGSVLCEDGRRRPPWAAADALTRAYYDTTWGVMATSDHDMFRALSFQVMQSGLTMRSALSKFGALMHEFRGFDPELVAAMTGFDVDRMLNMPELIRNERKLEAVITNAQALMRMRDEGTPFSDVVWSYRPELPAVPETMADIPNSVPEAKELARELKDHGFTFIGPKSIWLFMQATGVVNTHLADSWRRTEESRITAREHL